MPQVNARKKPRRKKATTEHYSFAIEVKDWEPSYSVRLEEGRHVSPSYQHSLHLDIKGVVIEPAKYAGQEIEGTFVGDQDMAELPKPGMTEWKPLGVATLTWRGKERSLVAGLPFEMHAHGFVNARGEEIQVRLSMGNGPSPRQIEHQVRSFCQGVRS